MPEYISISDDGWGEKDYLEWAWGGWWHRYSTGLASPHRRQDLSDGDRKLILESFGIVNWPHALEKVDSLSPDELLKIRSELRKNEV